MIAFIDDHRGAYGVEPICKVLPIAPSTYRAHVSRRIDPARLAPRTRRDLVLTAEIRRVFEANFRVYAVTTTGGQVLTGLLASESRTAVELHGRLSSRRHRRAEALTFSITNP